MNKEQQKLFPFQYTGCGYFRLKGYPKGEIAPILHGMEAIEYVFKRIREREQKKDDQLHITI